MSREEKILKFVREFVLFGIVVAIVVLWLIQWWLNRTPSQPIAFSHQDHVGEMQISCYYCHTGVLRGDIAGVPSVQDCMQCHQVINSDANPGNIPAGSADANEISKLMSYWSGDSSKNLQPRDIPWHKVYKLPKHVHFTHKAHVDYFLAAAEKDSRLGNLQQRYPGVYPCFLCHGNVANMSKIVPAGGFYKLWYGGNINPVTQMGYCVNCHNSYAGKTLQGGPDVPPRNRMIDCTQCHR